MKTKGKVTTVKKYVSLAVGTLILMGCASEGEEALHDDLPEEEAMQEDQEDMETLMEEPSDIEFLPQESDLAEGHDVESDPFLEEVEQVVHDTPEEELAELGNMGLYYTGINLEAEETDEMQAIVLLTNLTDDGVEGMEMTFSFGLNEDQLFIEEDTVILDEAFGVLAPYTARPLYITIDPENQEELENLEAGEAYVSIHDFDYTIAGEEERNP